MSLHRAGSNKILIKIDKLLLQTELNRILHKEVTGMSGFMEFNASKIKLNKIYETREMNRVFTDRVSSCDKTKEIYGEFRFPEYFKDRPYTYGSFVMSIDGKIAYNESPDGTLIARSNGYDPDGGLADYWILNLLRAGADASLVGARTISKEPGLTSKVYDEDLQKQRIKEGLSPIPVHVIATQSGLHFPASHNIVTADEIPAIIMTSPEGLKNLQKDLTVSFDILHYSENIKCSEFKSGKLILVTGEGSLPNISDAMKALKKLGIHRMVIESPMYLSLLMKEAMLDELFLNTSSIFIGGDSLSIAKEVESFTVSKHPHTQVITIHSHSDFFFYTRYRVLHDMA